MPWICWNSNILDLLKDEDICIVEGEQGESCYSEELWHVPLSFFLSHFKDFFLLLSQDFRWNLWLPPSLKVTFLLTINKGCSSVSKYPIIISFINVILLWKQFVIKVKLESTRQITNRQKSMTKEYFLKRRKTQISRTSPTIFTQCIIFFVRFCDHWLYIFPSSYS